MSFLCYKVAMLCEVGEKYLAQHMGCEGRWISSTDTKSCMTDKLEILQYCKKVFICLSFYLKYTHIRVMVILANNIQILLS
jgi:hypothetical protein